MKVKGMNFGREDFYQRGKKKRPLLSTPMKRYNPLSEQGNMKMFTLNAFADGLMDICPDIVFSSSKGKCGLCYRYC